MFILARKQRTQDIKKKHHQEIPLSNVAKNVTIKKVKIILQDIETNAISSSLARTKNHNNGTRTKNHNNEARAKNHNNEARTKNHNNKARTKNHNNEARTKNNNNEYFVFILFCNIILYLNLKLI